MLQELAGDGLTRRWWWLVSRGCCCGVCVAGGEVPSKAGVAIAGCCWRRKCVKNARSDGWKLIDVENHVGHVCARRSPCVYAISQASRGGPPRMESSMGPMEYSFGVDAAEGHTMEKVV